MTSVWSSGRFNTFVRCPACARMVNLEKIGAHMLFSVWRGHYRGLYRIGNFLFEPVEEAGLMNQSGHDRLKTMI